MTSTAIPVQGMTCSGCERSVSRALKRLDGVDAAEADAGAGRVTVEYDPDRVSEDDIRATVEKVGFTPA